MGPDARSNGDVPSFVTKAIWGMLRELGETDGYLHLGHHTTWEVEFQWGTQYFTASSSNLSDAVGAVWYEWQGWRAGGRE